MRIYIALLATTVLAACGGGSGDSSALNSGGSIPAAAPGTSVLASTSDRFSQFANPKVAATYAGLGGIQGLDYKILYPSPDGLSGGDGVTQQGLTYAGNSSTVRTPTIQVTYDPAASIFTLVATDPQALSSANVKFQDPASRTDFNGGVIPQWGVNNFKAPNTDPSNGIPDANILFNEAGDGNPVSPYQASGGGAVDIGSEARSPSGTVGSNYSSTTFFHQKPGSSTQYVTLAGFIRNSLSFAQQTDKATSGNPAPLPYNVTNYHLERGAFAYGAQADNGTVPTTGAATYTGTMIATMIYNPTIDGLDLNGKSGVTPLQNYYQWIYGTAVTTVDFGKSTVGLQLDGKVYAPQIDTLTPPTAPLSSIAVGTSFTASGTANIDLKNTGGYTGQINSASFGSTTNNTATKVTIANSAGINGAFFGPGGSPSKLEVGGGFRIVGGVPNQRVDILGAFTGK